MRIVATGTWLYSDTVRMAVHIVRLDYDFWYEIVKADGDLEPGELPDLNADGHLYYVALRDPSARASGRTYRGSSRSKKPRHRPMQESRVVWRGSDRPGSEDFVLGDGRTGRLARHASRTGTVSADPSRRCAVQPGPTVDPGPGAACCP